MAPGLSRELAGLRSWSGWKGPRTDSSDTDEDEDEGYGSFNLSISESERYIAEALTEAKGAENQLNIKSETTHMVSGRAGKTSRITVDDFIFKDPKDAERAGALNIDLEKIARDREGPDDTVFMLGQREVTSSASVQSLNSSPLEPAESEEDRAALAGPRCPLCICPINGVYFPVIICEDCDRTYHMKCIGYDRCDEYHPFYKSIIPDAKWCEGCGCPDGDAFGVYVGHPSVMFHRRDQDPGFKEYFRQGRLEEAKWEDLE